MRGAGPSPRETRPPWTAEAAIRAACTGCGACITACPEAILSPGRAGTPVLDFDAGACTFCACCAEACPEPVFAATDTRPWTLTARIGAACLLTRGIACQSCTDACDETALVFDMRAGRVGRITVADCRCTGCGACLSTCPAAAIALAPERAEATA